MTRHFTAREFNQNKAAANRALLDGPVFITNRGKAVQVLLSIEDYRRLIGGGSLVDMLSWPGTEDIELGSLIPSRTAGGRIFEFDGDDAA